MKFKLRSTVLMAFSVAAALAAAPTPPRDHFGFAIGDDYHLATYTQTEAYFQKLARESDRVRLVDIGKTEEGRTQWMLVISAPENIRELTRHRDTSARLARAENLTEAEARNLASTGKAIVWIDGGLHASETVGAHQLIETAWNLVSSEDAEAQRIRRDVIVLCVHANPDGQELVSNWYNREPVPQNRVLTTAPRLYQKYVGHDNNRDFYLSAMKETANMNRQLYLEWFPQVVYNHHQAGPAGTIIFVPPFRDPFNYLYDPLVVTGVESLGSAIQTRLLEEGKAGATTRTGANYSTWFNGSLRTTTYFHNMIGLLTEIVGNPTPMQIPLVARRQLPSGDLPLPVAPQTWHFRQSIDYSVSANRAVLDHASRHRDALLYNSYRMGRNSIERGRGDHWTPRPGRIDEVVRLAGEDKAGVEPDPDAEPGDTAKTPTTRLAPKYYAALRKPEWRDPRGYILPADQTDFSTAVKFVNALLKCGIVIHRSTGEFKVEGNSYPAGSFIVKCDQAFRPHVLDMFEPQDHPNDFRYEGGPPNKPYDVAGWTLAFQMGVKFTRILEGFDGPFERIPYGQLQTPPPAPVAGPGAGFLISHQVNDSFILVNRLLKAGADVYRRSQPSPELTGTGPGAFYVPDRGPARAIVEKATTDLGLTARAVPAPPTSELLRVAPARIGLWDRFGGSMPSGWTRWLLEQFEFPFEVVYSPRVDEGRLRESFDALIFVAGAIPAPGGRTQAVTRPRNLPPEFENRIGRLTAERSIPAIRDFLHAGGTVVAIGSSTSLAYHLGLPIANALAEPGPDGKERALPDTKFYIPGSIIEARVDSTQPIAWGMPERGDFYFDRSAAFILQPSAAERGLTPIAWIDSERPLRSGWAWGQKYLRDRVVAASASVGAGRLHLMGAEVAFRGQTHGTFKLLFNALVLAAPERP